MRREKFRHVVDIVVEDHPAVVRRRVLRNYMMQLVSRGFSESATSNLTFCGVEHLGHTYNGQQQITTGQKEQAVMREASVRLYGYILRELGAK